jgi:hypothetical protein
MADSTKAPSPDNTPPDPWPLRRKIAFGSACAIVAWFLGAYLLMPAWWRRYIRRHPSLDDVPGITVTKQGIPGDPLNVALVGTKEQIDAIMQAAGWYPADPLGLKSDMRIGVDTVLKKSYDEAPVSNLYLFGRKEDLAFEKPVGKDPRKRNHVRFWKTDNLDGDGRPLWVGSATFDERVGLSHTTGQITHHISGDVDAERDLLFTDLQATGKLSETYFEDDFHKIKTGKNGGGDEWHTDGRLEVGVIATS